MCTKCQDMYTASLRHSAFFAELNDQPTPPSKYANWKEYRDADYWLAKECLDLHPNLIEIEYKPCKVAFTYQGETVQLVSNAEDEANKASTNNSRHPEFNQKNVVGVYVTVKADKRIFAKAPTAQEAQDGGQVVMLKRGRVHIMELELSIQHDEADAKAKSLIYEMGVSRQVGNWVRYAKQLDKLICHDPNRKAHKQSRNTHTVGTWSTYEPDYRLDPNFG